jgi:hypothetical protein
MGRMRDGLGFLLAALLGLVGCTSNEPHLKPPKPHEEYNVPPEQDARFSKPVEYPKEVMERDPFAPKYKDKDGPGNPGSMRSPRLGGGAGPY